MSVNFSLEGKVALVTGASYGIGFAVFKGMAKVGEKMVLTEFKKELVVKGIEAKRKQELMLMVMFVM